MVAALGLLALATPAGASAQPSVAPRPGPVTVPAPGAGDQATVTVSKTDRPGEPDREVSWAGFRPSSADRLQNAGDSLDGNTQNPVRVYECRGTDPASSSDCYGSPGFRGVAASGTTPAIPAVPPFTYLGQTNPFDATPDGPANWQDNITHADGSGEVTIQVFTKRESAGLGCDVDAPCSIVVVPNYGRPQGATEDVLDAPWAWARRTVRPAHVPVGGRRLRDRREPRSGSRAARWPPTSWRRGARARAPCRPTRSTLDYTSIGEEQTRGDVASAVTDVGLVINPLDADAAATAGVVYSPVSVTGLVVAFQIDDAHGRPVTSLRLNARLVAKLITASYRTGGDPAVVDNPSNIFHDPEFLKLNPGVDWPDGAPGNHVAAARGPVRQHGGADPLDRERPRRPGLPQGQARPLGDDGQRQLQERSRCRSRRSRCSTRRRPPPSQPIQGMDAVARQLSIAQFPGAFVTEEDGQNVTIKPPAPEPRGPRGDRDHRRRRRVPVPDAHGVPAERVGRVREAHDGLAPGRDQALEGQRRRGHPQRRPGLEGQGDLPAHAADLRRPLDQGRQGDPRPDGRLPRLRRRSGAGSR